MQKLFEIKEKSVLFSRRYMIRFQSIKAEKVIHDGNLFRGRPRMISCDPDIIICLLFPSSLGALRNSCCDCAGSAVGLLAAAVFAGGHSGGAAEGAVETFQVFEAALLRDAFNVVVAPGQPDAGEAEPAVEQILVRADAEMPLE